ncbi:protein unc-13 homolog isoform X2 [Andrographis paniculata]|uniref:protein unc-13 homolog isoform X2 n=1 Tax=Andrographis paniculata TaxID=175694 RepID=UPI0021E80F94|nr:protein unc-13 homolog isoform X2 [Andrographis paniculata]
MEKLTVLQSKSHLQPGSIFYLNSDPESAGSPPRRAPPPITKHQEDTVESCSAQWSNHSPGEKSFSTSEGTKINCEVTAAPETSYLHNPSVLSIGLPTLETGLGDDDLRECAYEVFLASMLYSGVQIQSTEARKREKGSRFLTGLKSKREKRHVESQSPERALKVLDTVRVQMQISEAADTLIRRRLTQYEMVKSGGRIDIPQLSLALLTGILRSDFPSPKSYLNWKNRQANVLQEFLASNHTKTEKQVGVLLTKIRTLEEWDIKLSPSERSDVLLSLRQIVLSSSSKPGRFGMEGETYYWTAGYYLHIRLYEKLLCGLFDILEDGQLIEESEEVLKLLKLTWPMLGITERLHHALFSWVLFQQFVATHAEESALLDYAICEVEKVLSAEVCDDREVAYIKTMMCFAAGNEREIRLNLLQSIFMSISSWCDSKLQDYHRVFAQKSSLFVRVMTMGLSAGTRDFVSHVNIKIAELFLPDESAAEKIKTCVKKSLDAVCLAATHHAVVGSSKDNMHPLVILANELRLIAEKDLSIFTPIILRWCPECAMVSARILHQFYGERLKPFLKEVTTPSEDVRKVLSAAYSLERCLTQLYSSACKENNSNYCQDFERYPIAEISKSLLLEWVVAQNDRILEWTGRTFDLEEWEPLSSQKKHAASAVEVFRIIEETVDQFFEWHLPVDITHLQALLSIIFHSLDAYLTKVYSQLVDQQNLYPSTPPLTRYKDATFPMVKKKVVESSVINDVIYNQLDDLTTSKLCIRLNTYRYIQKQIALLEDGIRKSWEAAILLHMDRYSTEETRETLETTNVDNEAVSELFVATLDCISDSASQAIRKTSDFLGAKIVFWDMRDSFLYHLYHDNVEGNRMEGILPEFDRVLNNVSSLIDATIRDLVVSSIWKASLEGFMWVLLDGGPSRAFSNTDIPMIEEDFNMLKELFVAEGEGLPRSSVEQEAKFYHQIMSLFSLKTESLVQMLMASSEHISAGLSRSNKHRQRYVGDAHTIIRVLCHKKDKEASKFLKMHYRLPPSSEYSESPGENSGSISSSSFSSPYVTDLLKKSASIRWSEKGQNSFRSFRKKLQEVGWS